MSRFQLRDLPPEALEKLKPLSHHEFDLLSIEATQMRERDETADLPTDPLKGLKGAWEVLGRKPEGVEDDHMDDIHNAVRVACLVLGREEELSGGDCHHLWAILDRAETLLRWEKQSQEEQRRRMYKVLEAHRPL